MIRLIAKIFFIHLFGWKIGGAIPYHLKKCIIVVAPHTSYWDFFVGISVRPITGLRTRFLAKKELFKYSVFNWILRRMGGLPVDRQNTKVNLVQQVVDLYNENETLTLAIAPEGTRSAVNKWKTGFYRIAEGANVPIVPCAFDFGNKEVVFMKEFYPTGNMKSDIDEVMNMFSGIKGKHPELGVK